MKNISYNLFFKAFSNNSRIEIIKILRKGPRSVGDIAKMAALEQSRVSHNLKCLIDCGFVSFRQEGKSRSYFLNGEIKPILKSVDTHIKNYHKQLLACGILKEEK